MDEFVEFGEAVLGNLEALVPEGTTQVDLALELGITACLHQGDVDLDTAYDELWAARRAVLAAGRLDPASEPIPLGGRSPQSALVTMTIYLGALVVRAAANAGCDTGAIVDRAVEELASPASRIAVGTRHLRERRTS